MREEGLSHFQNGQGFVCRMIVVLTAPFAIWKVRNRKGLTAQEMATEDVRNDLHKLGHVSERKEDMHTHWNDLILKKKREWGERDLCFLSLDGGGSRGFIQTQVLLHLEHRINGRLMDYVDWVAGTSCGGIVALMLTSGYNLQYIRYSLFVKKDKVFCGNKVKVPKHNSKGIEGIGKALWGDARMNTVHKRYCTTSFIETTFRVLIPVADAQLTPASMILFRSYQPRVSAHIKEKHGYLDPDRILVWKAARCTSYASKIKE